MRLATIVGASAALRGGVVAACCTVVGFLCTHAVTSTFATPEVRTVTVRSFTAAVAIPLAYREAPGTGGLLPSN